MNNPMALPKEGKKGDGVKGKLITVIALFALLGIIGGLYGICANGEFVYDDNAFILENAYVKNLGNVKEFFVNRFSVSATGHYLWRPLRTLSFAMEYALGKGNPVFFHLTNILLHCLNALLVFFIAQIVYRANYEADGSGTDAMPSSDIFALLSAALWGFHPMQTETVCWISCRGDLLYTFFIFIGLLCSYRALEGNVFDKKAYFVSQLTFGGALLSKETAVIFPILLILFVSLTIRNIWRRKAFHLAAFFAPFFIMAILYIAVRAYIVQSVVHGAFWGTSLQAFLLTLPLLCIVYGRLLFVPVGHQILYALRPVEAMSDPRFIVSAIVLVGIIICCIIYRRRLKMIPLGMSLIAIPLLPALNMKIQEGFVLTEHFLYVSILGWAFVLSDCFVRYWNRRFLSSHPVLFKTGGIACISVILISYIFLSASYCVLWRSPLAFWEREAHGGVQTAKALGGMGEVYYLRGAYEKARYCYEKALERDSGDVGACVVLADVAVRAGDLRGALRYAEQAIAIDGTSPNAHWALGKVYAARGAFEAAEKELQEAIRLYPGRVDYYLDLGMLYDKHGHLDEAIAVYAKILKINWNEAKVHNNLGIVYHKKGDLAKAVFHWQQAVTIDPRSESASRNLSHFAAHQKK
ncbi:MAG: tetratricopeptide repeat protein [Candidatus Omnitrophica bacterium]|nr:tetratricopeptide repeat protein [Candidatus Omnitrophota bacterium]